MKTETRSQAEIGIIEKDRREVASLLNALLADESVLAVKTRNFHWNAAGVGFAALHALFEKQYQELDAVIDETAERVRALGLTPFGSMGEFLEGTRLREFPGAPLPAERMLTVLLEDHEELVRTLRQGLTACAERNHDAGTADFLTALLRRHEKLAWMLRSHLEG